mmetsp:Transcript_135841/g.321963  ORF Transcript_135841/g.321963 Transcript_135841/m.321963 type:complete len:200 (+) Transcript_135841:719-1318(+)
MRQRLLQRIQQRPGLHRQVPEAKAHDAVDGHPGEGLPVLLRDQAQRLLLHHNRAKPNIVRAQDPCDAARGVLRLEAFRLVRLLVGLRGRAIEAVPVVHGAGAIGAEVRVHPEVCAAGVVDHPQLRSRATPCAVGPGAHAQQARVLRAGEVLQSQDAHLRLAKGGGGRPLQQHGMPKPSLVLLQLPHLARRAHGAPGAQA